MDHILYPHKIGFLKNKIKFPSHRIKDRNEELMENYGFLVAINMVYIYSCVNFSLSCPTELFDRSCLTSVEMESLWEVCDQVYVVENHKFFIMILIKIFVVIFFARSYIFISRQLSSTVTQAKGARVKFKDS